jgi:ParB-like chromosome segregation protein Spo0J
MGDRDYKALTAELCKVLAGMSEDARIDVINEVRQQIHAVSPLKHHPVDLVLWVKSGDVIANTYNPNTVAPPEMRLLAHSVAANGYTMPIVTHQEDRFTVVDGFHRHRVGKEVPEIRDSVHGRLPVSCIRAERADLTGRIAATVEHNRARGEHQVQAMSDLVQQLYQAGWRDDKIMEELGMQADELLRHKQIQGLAELFAEREFSEGWEPR